MAHVGSEHMDSWLISIILLLAFVAVLGLATHALVRRTGYAKKPHFPWSLLGPLGAGCAVAVAAGAFNLSGPWLVLVAGISAGALQLLAQVVCSHRAV